MSEDQSIKANAHKRILMVSHDASRSGAPLLLLNLAQILKETGKFEIDFILMRKGELGSAFRSVGDTYYPLDRSASLAKKIYYKFRDEVADNLSAIDLKKYDVILANTVVAGNLLADIRKQFRGPVISYIHELKMVAEYMSKDEKNPPWKAHSDFFLVPSETVSRHLEKNFSIPPEKIMVMPYYIPAINAASSKTTVSPAFLVGGCGTAEFRKGTDIFMELARRFHSRYAALPVKFIWKGADVRGMEYRMLADDAARLSMESYFSFEPASASMEEFYGKLGAFALTSREDPYPLVVLEAARHGVPSVCFQGSGGAEEFITDTGVAVPFYDVDAVCDVIAKWSTAPAERNDAGSRALRRLTMWHQQKGVIIGKFNEAIRRAENKNG